MVFAITLAPLPLPSLLEPCPSPSGPSSVPSRQPHTEPEPRLLLSPDTSLQPRSVTSPGWKSPVNRSLCSTHLSQSFNSAKRIGFLVVPSIFQMLKSKLPLKSTKANLHWLGCMPNHQKHHQDAQAITNHY